MAVKSRRDICAEMGLDFDDVIAQIAAENALMAEMGIVNPPPAAAPIQETEDAG